MPRLANVRLWLRLVVLITLLVILGPHVVHLLSDLVYAKLVVGLVLVGLAQVRRVAHRRWAVQPGAADRGRSAGAKPAPGVLPPGSAGKG